MKKMIAPLEVTILEEEDLVGIDEEARALGRLNDAAFALQKKIPGAVVQPHLTVDRRQRPLAQVSINGVKLSAGDAFVIHPLIGTRAFPAAMLADAVPLEPEEKPAPAKKATKKAAKAPAGLVVEDDDGGSDDAA